MTCGGVWSSNSNQKLKFGGEVSLVIMVADVATQILGICYESTNCVNTAQINQNFGHLLKNRAYE